MAIRCFALVAALAPAIAFGTNTTSNVSKTWDVSAAVTALLANNASLGGAFEAAAAGSKSKLAGFALTSIKCEASGPSATGVLEFSLTSSAAALADPMFPRWIAQGIANTMGCDEHLVDVSVEPSRRLTSGADGRRLTGSVKANFNVYNPKRGRNIGLGVGLGLVAPGLGLGLGLGEGLLRKPTPAPVTEPPVTAPPAPMTTTAAPQEGSSMPLWAGILLGLAVLACIGAAVFFGTQKKEKKKRAVKKAAPVKEEVKVVEEVVPMLASPVPVVQTYQPAPAFQSVQYVQQAPAVTYAAPAVQTVQAAPVYTSISRGF